MHKFTLAAVSCAVLLCCAPAFAIDGQVLINQSTVMAAGGFPYKITQPGSYKLSGNLVVPANTNGIVIEANGVTLDLNGFAVSGPLSCTGLGESISCSNDPEPNPTYGIVTTNLDFATVKNGTVSGFSGGLNIEGIAEDIFATSNLDYGISVSDGVMERCAANFNRDTGLAIAASAALQNTANFNGEYGLRAATSSFSSNVFLANGNDSPGAQILLTASVSGNNNSCNGSAC